MSTLTINVHPRKKMTVTQNGIAIGPRGYTPYIQDGNWWINGEDTGVRAEGIKWSDLTPEQKDELTLKFEDLTPEQKAEIRGEKGDPFTYSDFTQEQIDALQKPATDAAATANQAAETANNAATLANNAATLANQKATLANEAATLATTKANLADEKAGLADQKATEANQAAETANNAAIAANQAAGYAGEAGDYANAAAALAVQKAGSANDAATAANTAANLANQKAVLADEKALLADQKATEANTAAGSANNAAIAANTTNEDIQEAEELRVAAETARNVASNIYNVTLAIPLTAGQYYTSTTARAAVPAGVRKIGLIITYETSAGAWVTERFKGVSISTWVTATDWEEIVGPLKYENMEEVAAEALVLLKNRIDALQKIINDMILGTVQIDTLSVVKTFNLFGSSNLILTGTAAPAVVPDFIGQFFIKTSATTACYQATGNSSVNDWRQIG